MQILCAGYRLPRDAGTSPKASDQAGQIFEIWLDLGRICFFLTLVLQADIETIGRENPIRKDRNHDFVERIPGGLIRYRRSKLIGADLGLAKYSR